MPDHSIDRVSSRIDALERKVALLERFGAATCIIAIAVAASAMAWEEAVPEVLKARKFIAVSRDGGPGTEVDSNGLVVHYSSGGSGALELILGVEHEAQAEGAKSQDKRAGLGLTIFEDGVSRVRVGRGSRGESHLVLNSVPLTTTGVHEQIVARTGGDDVGGRPCLLITKDGKVHLKVPE